MSWEFYENIKYKDFGDWIIKTDVHGHGPSVVHNLPMVYSLSFVSYQTQSFARPSPDQDFESCNLYWSLLLCDK